MGSNDRVAINVEIIAIQICSLVIEVRGGICWVVKR